MKLHLAEQLCVESNDAMAIVTLSDGLKSFAPGFQAMRGKTKTNRTWCARFSPRFTSKRLDFLVDEVLEKIYYPQRSIYGDQGLH